MTGKPTKHLESKRGQAARQRAKPSSALHELGHVLPYREYLRAKKLGVAIPEAKPLFSVGLLDNCLMPPVPIEVVMPKDHPLERCYRMLAPKTQADYSDRANAHLLAALGQLDPPFVPVTIPAGWDGYSWARLANVKKIEVTVGKVLKKEWVGSGYLTCVDALSITARTSDGNVFTAPVCMAIKPSAKPSEERQTLDVDTEVYVTPQAQDRLDPLAIWYHFGGVGDDEDTQAFDKAVDAFENALQKFWTHLRSPYALFRAKLQDSVAELKEDWSSVTFTSDGTVAIGLKNGETKISLRPVEGVPA